MLLKSHLQALFKLSGSQAMPKSQWVDLDSSASQVTAQNDGWMKCVITTSTAEHPWFAINIANGLSVNLQGASFVGGNAVVFVPVKKGDVVSFQLNNCTMAAKQLFPLVGGGG